MSRLFFLAIAFFSTPALAQIEPMNVAQIFQDGHVVGLVYVDLPPGPCRSVEQWFLFEDYQYPDRVGDGFTVGEPSNADMSFERFLADQYAAHPKGTLVTVEIEETSAICP